MTSTVLTLSFFSTFEADALITGGGRHEVASLLGFDDKSFNAFDEPFELEVVSLFLLLDGAGKLESLFRLRLESLRADEKPLLELVLFDDFERSLSLKSLSLSSIECFVVPLDCGGA